jgi:hypothetical protein
VQVAPGGQDGRRAQQVAARRGPHEAAVQRAQIRPGSRGPRPSAGVALASFFQQRQALGGAVPAAASDFGRLARHQGLHRGAVQPLAVRRLGQRQQQVDPLRRRWAAPTTCRPCGISVYSSSSTCSARRRMRAARRRPAPGGFGGGQLQLGGLGLDHLRQFAALALGLGLQAARQRSIAGLQVDQALVQAGLRHRRREVADQRGGGPALGDGAFAGVVAGVEVEVGQVADQRSGQQLAVMPFCLPGMNSSAPWVPKCSTAWAPKSSRR